MNPQIMPLRAACSNLPIDGESTAARLLWVPATSNHGGLRRCDFVQSADPWNAENMDKAVLSD